MLFLKPSFKIGFRDSSNHYDENFGTRTTEIGLGFDAVHCSKGKGVRGVSNPISFESSSASTA